MSWQYYKNGKLRAESNDIPETIEDAVIELKENGIDVSDCVVDDCWSPDYPPEEEEYKNTMICKPLTDKEVEEWEKVYKILEEENKALTVSGDFNDKLWAKINAIKGVPMKQTRLTRLYKWCKKWTDEEITYLVGWLFALYLMVGVVKYEPSILEVILWPFIKG